MSRSMRKPQGGVGTDAAWEENFVDAAWRHLDRASERILADTQRGEELFKEHFARVDIW